MLARAYLADGDEAVYSQQSFVSYALAVGQVNGRPVTPAATPGAGTTCRRWRRRSGRAPSSSTWQTVQPTGTYFTRGELDAYFEVVGHRALTVIDQAYHE